MTAFGWAEASASGPRTAAHAYRNARQSVLLLEHARRSGLSRTFAAGLAQIGEVEAAIRAYAPDPTEAEEHADALRLVRQMREEASRLAGPRSSSASG